MALQFVFVLAVVAKSVLATTCPSSCPNLNIASGSQPITQTMTTNQYNCTSPNIKCVNPNGGTVYFVFYNNGSQSAALGSSNGTIDTQVICSSENYLWVFVNNGSSTARIDTVSCVYGSPSANTTKAPSTGTTKAYACPTLNVASGSEPINQTMTTNQYNLTSPNVKCVNPNGGSVYLVFYNNGSQVAALGSSNGTIDTQVICSTENYLWVFVNNGSSTARVDTVSCIYGSSSANTTKAPSTAATTAYNYIAACNSCPKTLAVNSGSLAISQTTGTNQYNCSVVNLYCPSSNGGNISFKFYYNGTQVASVSGNGAVFDAVNCSTEKYQWITVNGAGVKVSSVTCSSP